MGKLKAAFLDEDGVLNTAVMINNKPATPTTLNHLCIPSEVKPCLDRLKAAGYLLICVTNKPDVERGLMTQADVDTLFNELRRQLPLDDIYAAYHKGDRWYKPNPGSLLDAAKKYNIDLAQSFMVGDRHTDIECGKAAGCGKTIWINRYYPLEPAPNPAADFTTESLTDAVNWILKGDK